MVLAFPKDISVFLSLPYAPEVYLRCWNFLEDYPVKQKLTWLTFVRTEGDNPLGPLPSNISLNNHPLWGLSKHFLLLGRIFVSKWGLRPNIKVQAFAPHNIYMKFLDLWNVKIEKKKYGPKENSHTIQYYMVQQFAYVHWIEVISLSTGKI